MNKIKGQSALEYMLLLATAAVIALVGFKVFLPRVQNSSDLYFNRVSYGITGTPIACGDGICADPFENRKGRCCIDCPGDANCH